MLRQRGMNDIDIGLKACASTHDRVASDLLRRCDMLLNELEIFETYLYDEKDYKTKTVELGRFKHDVRTECKVLQKLSDKDPNGLVRSTNLLFYEAVWNTAKTCTGVTALEKRVTATDTKHQIIVNIVARGGLEWIKVSTITERRLLFDMAKAGWAEDESSGDDDDDSSLSHLAPGKTNGLMKHMEAYLEVSQTIRIRYRHPQLRIVLPNITRNSQIKEIRDFILQLEDLGVIVQTTEDLIETLEGTNTTKFNESGINGIKIETVKSQLVFDPFLYFSETINVDCTILLALVSDLSHERVKAKDWHHPAILRQIDAEKDKKLLPNVLWPACGSHELVCTKDAADMMYEIIGVIGTDSEKERTRLLLQKGMPRDELLSRFQTLSSYKIPATWKIPIKVIQIDLATIQAGLPPPASDIARNLSLLNQSIFFYGWANRLTTITSNRGATNRIITSFEEHRRGDDDMGPDIWVCQTSRSLVGKEKSRR